MRAKNVKFLLLENWLGGSLRLEGIRGCHILSIGQVESGFDLPWPELGGLIRSRTWSRDDLLVMDPEQVFWIRKFLGATPRYSAVLKGYLANTCISPNGLDAFSCRQLALALEESEKDPFDLFSDVWYISCLRLARNTTGAELSVHLDAQMGSSAAAHLIYRQGEVRGEFLVDHQIFLGSFMDLGKATMPDLHLAAFQMGLVSRG